MTKRYSNCSIWRCATSPRNGPCRFINWKAALNRFAIIYENRLPAPEIEEMKP